jgi:glycosyltransferase involved in cell wall biosynthesis
MAGMGIRALELARSLRREGVEARLLAPNDAGEAKEAAGDVPVARAAMDALAEAAGGAGAAVVSGHAASWWFHQVPGVPAAADLYDPFPIENLHYAETLGEETARHDRFALSLALARADFFLCASADQRLFYSGALYQAGRIGTGNFPGDPELSGLLAVVPFGVPEAPARGDRSEGRRAAGVPEAGPLVLFGGIYDWYDPAPLLEAWPGILARRPEAKLLFLDNPNPDSTPQRIHGQARARARAIDPQGRSIFFSPWLPYARRADLYAASDLIVSISSPGLETDLSFRTRLLDAAWGGLASVSMGGGTLARDLDREGAGVSISGDAAALAAAVGDLLSDDGRRARLAQAARGFAARHTWRQVVAPLAAWCRNARVDPHRRPFPDAPEAGRWKNLRKRVLGRSGRTDS